MAKKGSAYVCEPCGRELIITEAGSSLTELVCCHQEMMPAPKARAKAALKKAVARKKTAPKKKAAPRKKAAAPKKKAAPKKAAKKTAKKAAPKRKR